MELEEMKVAWEALSKKVEKQERLTNETIEKMTEHNYSSKLNKIAYSEYIGTVICYTGAAYLILNFAEITTLTMQVFCVVDILLLFILPVISLKSLKDIKDVHISTQSYSETIREYALHKIRFQKLQKWNVALAMFLMVTGIPVLTTILGKDISAVPDFWTLIFPLGVLFFTCFSIWVLRYYNRILKQAEEVLSEVNN